MNELGERAAKPLDRRRPTRRREPVSAAIAPVSASESASVFSASHATNLRVTSDEAGQRLDNFLLRRAKGVPKSHVYRLIRGGDVRVNGKRTQVDYRIAGGDVLRLPPLRIAAPAASGQPGDAAQPVKRERAVAFDVVYEDDDLLVVDKPAGVAVHGGSGIAFGVIEQLRHARPDARVLELVHRLDRETSGLLMVAKKRSALVQLHEDLREGRVRKRYLALSNAHWPEKQRQIKAALTKFTLPAGERRVRVSDDADIGRGQALQAHTVVRRLESFDGPDGPFALLEVELKTGRTHQIRVHLAHLGRSISGDDKYGDFEINKRLARPSRDGTPGLRRMFLHAAHLDLMHPRTGVALALEAPLPGECVRFLDRLRASSVAQVR